MDLNGTILALIDDLFFSVKVEEVAQHQEYTVETVDDARAFHRALSDEQPAMAIVNLSSCGPEVFDLIREASRLGISVLTFGPHVDKEAHRAAREAGARASVTNSQLMRELPALIRELVHGL